MDARFHRQPAIPDKFRAIWLRHKYVECDELADSGNIDPAEHLAAGEFRPCDVWRLSFTVMGDFRGQSD
jgi:hypothetical protein